MIVLRYKNFARKDYEGLTGESASYLKEQRSKIAKQLNKFRNENKKHALDAEDLRDMNDDIRRVAKIQAKGAKEAANDIERINKIGNNKRANNNSYYRQPQPSQNMKVEVLSVKTAEPEKPKAKPQVSAAEETARKAERLKKSKESIAKHQAQADKLRTKKLVGRTAKGVAITGATAGAVYGAKKLYDKKKKG